MLKCVIFLPCDGQARKDFETFTSCCKSILFTLKVEAESIKNIPYSSKWIKAVVKIHCSTKTPQNSLLALGQKP